MSQASACERICSGCGATAPGMRPVGWTFEPVYEPDYKLGRVLVGERPVCLDCQHPELREQT